MTSTNPYEALTEDEILEKLEKSREHASKGMCRKATEASRDMRERYSKEEVLRQYEESGRIMYQATLDGDYKTNNREGERLTKIFKYFEKNREFALDCIYDMLCSQNVVVRTKAAAYCLALNENVEMAENVLSEISNNKENGIFGFNAKMTLDVWNKQGYLRIYPAKK